MKGHKDALGVIHMLIILNILRMAGVCACQSLSKCTLEVHESICP